MIVAFFGTPAWAVPSLDALLASGIEVVAVVTNPDRPSGRGMKLRPGPVKVRALEAGLEVWQPERARDPQLQRRLDELKGGRGLDVCVVVAYGSLLPPQLLEIPSLGFVNVHFSLLPAYRGAAPVQRAIMAGDTVTGVSLMVLTEGMDEGPVLARHSVDIAPDDTSGSLGEKLARVGAELLAETLPVYVAGELEPEPQDDDKAAYAPKLTTEDGRIDWQLPAVQIRDLVRALNPSPGAWTTFRGGRVKIYEVMIDPGSPRLPPGELRDAAGLVVGTGDDPVAVVEAQMATKRRMAGPELARGLHAGPGERFA